MYLLQGRGESDRSIDSYRSHYVGMDTYTSRRNKRAARGEQYNTLRGNTCRVIVSPRDRVGYELPDTNLSFSCAIRAPVSHLFSCPLRCAYARASGSSFPVSPICMTCALCIAACVYTVLVTTKPAGVMRIFPGGDRRCLPIRRGSI